MPRNHDEAVEWPDEACESIADAIHRLELAEQLSEQLFDPLEDSYDNEDPQDHP